MKTTELIQKLQNIESQNPGSEINFHLREIGDEPHGFNITFVEIHETRTSEGTVWILQFATDRILPK